MQRAGYVRLLVSLFVCFSVILYNFFGWISPFYETQAVTAVPATDGEVLQEESVSQDTLADTTESQPQETAQSQTQTSSQSTESIAASAGEVKGRIISKYISPYSAPLSYNKVYIKNSTGIDIDIKKLTEAALGFSIEQNESPQVLIVHTHATESFMSTDSTYYTDDFSPRSKDNSKNMVKIGDIVAEKLNNAGIKTLHDATLHDYPEYTGSYTRSAKTIKSYLSKYPDIKIVLDLHRDSVASGESDKVKLVTEIGGKKAAQVMLVMGSQTGSVTGHPNWQENLKLAFKLQQKLENNYPTLARPLMLMSKLYNQNLTTGSLLLEFGTDANSLEEACYSAELVGNALAELLKE